MKFRVLLVMAISLMTTWIAAQTGLPAMAGVSDGQIVIYNGTPQTVAAVNNVWGMRWSADGQYLAYITTASDGNYALYVTSGGAPTQLAADVSYLPPSFDGQAVIYGRDGESIQTTDQGPLLPIQLYRQAVDGESSLIGEIGFGVGCGGGSYFPMDGVYNTEAGFGGRALTLDYTDYGVIYSLNCAGVGLGLLDLSTGETRILSETISRSLVRGSQVIGVNEAGGIQVIDLASGSQRNVGTSQSPDQITTDGQTLYYSVRILQGEPLPLSVEEAEALGRTMGLAADSVPQYQVAIYQLDLASGAESQIYSEHGWAIGRLFLADGALYFSLIPNGEGWVEALATGAIDPFSAESFQQSRLSVQPTILRVSGGDVLEVASGIYQATPRP